VTAPLLFLVGYRGTGKSTVGRVLAARLGWAFADADERLEAAAGMSIADVFTAEGEAGFRDRESAVVAEVCRLTNHVVATGGGVVLRPQNRELLKSGFVAWLTASPETLWERLQTDPTTAGRRPNLTARGGLEEIRHLLAAREPFYREVAAVAVPTENLSPDAAADAILRAWETGGSTFRPSSGACGSSSSG
jgi:shikimate kinase